MTATATSPALLAMRGIVKEFPGVRANDGVDFELRRGEIHALLGENGAGKTTLMNILAGLYRPDAGAIELAGEPVELKSPRAAIDAGIGMVHQHFRLIDRFTVAENVTLGWHAPRALLSPRRLEGEIARLSDVYRMAVDPSRPVWQLSVGEQQRVEILKNLHREANILILDEPTAVLTHQEAEELFASLRSMAAEGRGVVFISHKLREVEAVADRVTVLRHGRVTGTVAVRDTSQAELALLMFGHEVAETRRPPGPAVGAEVLQVDRLEARDERGLPSLRGVSLELRSGEILGIAGVAGNGQVALAETIMGLRPATAGTVRFRGADITSWPVARRIDAGIGYSPEDRLRHGVAPSLSLVDNLVAKAYRSAPVGGRFLVDRRAARRLAEELVERFDVRGGELDAPAASLSGGNLQKLVLGRELAADPPLLIAAQPTRGLDLGATEATRGLLLEHRNRGRAVLLISEDLEELLAVCDRIAVIYEGTITGTFGAEEADIARLGLLMAGKDAAA